MSQQTSGVDGEPSVEELRRELAQAREREAVTGEVLGIIASTSDALKTSGRSSIELQNVLDALTAAAVRLCGADKGLIRRRDGDRYVAVSTYAFCDEFKQWVAESVLELGHDSIVGRAASRRQTVHIPDVLAESDWQSGDWQQLADFRSAVAVPFISGADILGVLVVHRTRPIAFTGRQIELLETFADQAVIAIENARLFNELTETVEQQRTTGDILRAIANSPGNAQAVLDSIAQSAARLLNVPEAEIMRVDGQSLTLVTKHGLSPQWPIGSSRPINREWVTGRAIVDRSTIHVADLQAAQKDFPEGAAYAKQFGHRTTLATPLLRQGMPIGAILIRRMEERSFSNKQIKLLETFADQAVIAIENTRLFEAEQASKRELREALDYRTATSDVLNVISRSPSRLQPVFDTLVESAARLCQAEKAQIFRCEGTTFNQCASYGLDPRFGEYVKTLEITPGRGSVTGRVLLEGKTVQIIDVLADPDYSLDEAQRLGGFRTHMGVPLLRQGTPIGVIILSRTIVRPFTDKQIELAETFADQAVIAIENTRLFEEVQARTRELQESLEYQTASSEVLGVISQSPSQAQPVFEAIVATARQLCQAEYALIFRLGGDDRYHLVAHSNTHQSFLTWLQANPCAAGDGSAVGLVALEKHTIHMPDALADPRFSDYRRQREARARTMVAVPLLNLGQVIGVIWLARSEVKPFTDRQVDLVTTFANQAVIAVNNARLFEEVQARNRDLTALTEVGRAVSSTLDLKVVLKTIVDRAVTLSGTDAGSIFYYRPEVGRFELGETAGIAGEIIARLRKLDIAAKDSGLGEAIAHRKPLLIPDLTKRESNPLRAAVIEAGFRAALIVPLLSSDGPLGTLVLQRRQPGEFPQTVVTLMESFADQSAIALENARLFNEIAQKSRELEIASQHKSQFVANMSHELRTPLAAILGYAELMQEGFYEPQGPKSLDALTRIRANSKHLLGLINTVLDIAKIESGQFTLNMAEYAIESVVETVRSATESLAQNKKLALKTEIAKPLPIGLGDEQRLTQVLLNLVGNAIKFTDAGEVRIAATSVNGQFNVTVSDTGPGIPAEHQARIFDQFHQVDSSNTKAKGGTGLGLAIAKQIVEMHGGRIWVQSTLGQGSTFQMELPARAATT
jgi:GAF domain-containing protein/anti-sigma regulatory factor (Ser/Thr protein kinase)